MIRWLCLACLCASPAWADDVRPYGLERPADVTVAFARHDIDLARGADRIETTVERIGVAWREQFADYLTLGLLGGYSYLTQSGEPLTAGLEPDGYHAGFSVDTGLPIGKAWSLFVRASYLYERTDDAGASQEVTLSWSTIYGEAGLSSTAAGAARFYAGVSYGRLDGEERARGTINSTRDLSEDDRAGAMGGVEAILDRDGYVGVVARSGFYRGAGIYFGRRF